MNKKFDKKLVKKFEKINIHPNDLFINKSMTGRTFGIFTVSYNEAMDAKLHTLVIGWFKTKKKVEEFFEQYKVWYTIKNMEGLK